MADASYLQSSFLGGELSQWAQGRYDRQDYRSCLAISLNGHPVEEGTWTRRPGSGFAGTTRGGAPGRVVKFDFEAVAPYTAEFTDGFLRFRSGVAWASTNDSQVVLGISTANPAVVQTTSASGWATGNAVFFGTFGASVPLLQNRQFLITTVDSTHFSLTDALSGATIDGSTLGAIPAGLTVTRIQEITTPYTVGSWALLRLIQAETTAVIVAPNQIPQILTVTVLPSPGVDAQFSLAALVFNDGPYLDPPVNGAQITPGGTTGIITLTLGFPAYSATKAYAVGAFVVSVGVNYVSLVDQNLNNTPASSPSQWATTSAGAAINNGQGWLGTDIGRQVRLYSEPALWLVGTTYAKGNVVAYNPSGAPGASTYWTSLIGSNVGNIPGNDLTNWSLTPGNAAQWSWGRITSLATQISQGVAGATNIGNMTGRGGLAAAFDGVTVQARTACATFTFTSGGKTATGYVGRHFGGGAQQIGSVTVYPSSDLSFGSSGGTTAAVATNGITINLRGKATLPANSADGTLLGTTGAIANTTTAVSITSSDQATAWNYVWAEIIVTFTLAVQGVAACAELQFFNPSGTGSGAVANLEILGPPLLYTVPVITWRLGAYSGTTGYPTCGCYHEGRLWLGGAIPNRFDASYSNGIVGNAVNFAPTDQFGVVTAANGITYTLNSKGVNPLEWMEPDQQGILAGTLANQWLIAPPTAGPMSPVNIAARPITTIGCANIAPARTEHTLAFVHRYRRKVMEGFADVYSGKFTAPNLARDAMHITKPFVAELAYQQAVVPLIWGRCDDGSLFGVTYKRDTLSTSQGPTYAAWHRHTLGSGRLVESIATGPSTGGTLDALTMVTNDPLTGIRHVEILTDLPAEGSTFAAAAYLDDAVTPSSTVTSNTPIVGAPYGGLTLNGLWHLNGKTVTAWIAGLDCGDYAVSSGSVTGPYGDGVSAGTGAGLFTAAAFAANPTALVGFTFTSDGQCVRPNAPAESGARNGPGFGKKRRSMQYAAQLEGAQGLSFGTTFAKLLPALFKQPNGTAYLINQAFTGIHWDTLADDYSYDSMLCWRVTRPYPANVVAAGAFLQTMDK